MEFRSDQSSFLASLLGDIVLETQLSDLSFNNQQDTTDNSDDVVGCLVKSIVKRRKQSPKQRRELLKILRAPKVDLPLDPPPLVRTDDSYIPNFGVELNAESVI